MSKPNKLVYSTESLNDQFAVFSEMYYPKGWIAKVNGKETSIYSVNYILRGIEVPPGKNIIEFSFNPPVVSKGTKLRWMSAFLFLGIVIGIGYLQYRTKKST